MPPTVEGTVSVCCLASSPSVDPIARQLIPSDCNAGTEFAADATCKSYALMSVSVAAIVVEVTNTRRYSSPGINSDGRVIKADSASPHVTANSTITCVSDTIAGLKVVSTGLPHGGNERFAAIHLVLTLGFLVVEWREIPQSVCKNCEDALRTGSFHVPIIRFETDTQAKRGGPERLNEVAFV